MAARMAQLVQRHAMPVDWLEIGGWQGHLYVAGGWDLESPTSADPEVDARGLDQVKGDQDRIHAFPVSPSRSRIVQAEDMCVIVVGKDLSIAAQTDDGAQRLIGRIR